MQEASLVRSCASNPRMPSAYQRRRPSSRVQPGGRCWGCHAGHEEKLVGGIHLIMDARATRLLSNRAAVEAWVREAAALGDMAILALVGYDLRIAHQKEPGISVVAIIAESHISVHTWPEEGVVTMDMYSCRTFDTKPILVSLRQTFGVTEVLGSHTLKRFGMEKTTGV